MAYGLSFWHVSHISSLYHIVSKQISINMTSSWHITACLAKCQMVFGKAKYFLTFCNISKLNASRRWSYSGTDFEQSYALSDFFNRRYGFPYVVVQSGRGVFLGVHNEEK